VHITLLLSFSQYNCLFPFSTSNTFLLVRLTFQPIFTVSLSQHGFHYIVTWLMSGQLPRIVCRAALLYIQTQDRVNTCSEHSYDHLILSTNEAGYGYLSAVSVVCCQVEVSATS
jgi:hypothetical protein